MVAIHVTTKGMDQIISGFDRGLLELGDMRYALDEARDEFYAAVADAFSGNSWTSNRPLTIAKKGHGQVLHETGTLEDSYAGGSNRLLKRGGNWIQLGSEVPYALFQEEGFHNRGTVPAEGDVLRPVKMTGQWVPARPVITDELEDRVSERFVNAMLERLMDIL